MAGPSRGSPCSFRRGCAATPPRIVAAPGKRWTTTIMADPELVASASLFVDATRHVEVHEVCGGDVPQPPAIAPICAEAAPLLITTSTAVAMVP